MSDIVERLRNWRTVHLARLHLLMEEAADEMERLRQVVEQKNLTAEEREAVAYYLGTGGPYSVDKTLVALLSRTGSDAEKTGDDSAECHSQGVKCPERERLTDAERKAITWAANVTDDGWPGSHAKQMVSTLRGLLERL